MQPGHRKILDCDLHNTYRSQRLSYLTEQEYPAAPAHAYNAWLMDTWLTYDKRLLGTIHVAIQHPEAAAAEIYRCDSHPKIVQVDIPASTAMPISHPFYRPVLRAAAEMDLVVALHFRQPGEREEVFRV